VLRWDSVGIWAGLDQSIRRPCQNPSADRTPTTARQGCSHFIRRAGPDWVRLGDGRGGSITPPLPQVTYCDSTCLSAAWGCSIPSACSCLMRS
jgi:hypothetical protein